VRPREVPPVPTYRDAMASSYELMKQAAQDEGRTLGELRDAEEAVRSAGMNLAKDHDPSVSGTHYISRSTPPKTDEDKARVRTLWRADMAYQKAEESKKHWERYWRDYHDFITAHPELADTQLSLTKEWLPQRRRAK